MLLKIVKTFSQLNNIYISRKLCTTITQEQVAQIGSQTINFVKTGQGDKTIFCMPGALGTIWSDFKPQINGLDKDKFTIIAWDPPGYGNSKPYPKRFSESFYEDDADTAFKFLQALKIDKFSILGWSDGGITGLILAAKYPNSIEKLIVWGANAYVLPEELKAYNKLRDVSKWSEKMKSPLIKLYTEDGLKRLWNSWCDTMDHIVSKNSGNICKEIVSKIQSPTLILHGDKDPMVFEEHPLYLHKEITNSRLYRFPEGKHNIHLRYPTEFNKIVTEFLEA